MEPYQRQQLVKATTRVTLFMTFLVGIFWMIPTWVADYQPPPQEAPQPKKTQQLDIKELLAPHGLQPQTEDIYRNVHFATYLTDRAKELCTQLHATLEERSIENYVLSIDGIDQELYVYLDGLLTHRLLFIQNIPTTSRDLRPSKEEMPRLAIIIAGLGQTNNTTLAEHPTPLSFAFSPLNPFSLQLVHNYAQNWHEILIDARKLPAVSNPEELLPYASGVLYGKRTSLSHPFVMSFYPSQGKDNKEINPLAVLHRQYVDMPFAIARTKFIAQKRGFAALMIEATDPQLPTLLEWSKGAQQEGIMLVMASELRYNFSHEPSPK